MRLPILALVLAPVLGLSGSPLAFQTPAAPGPKGVRLDSIAWPDAEKLLTPDAVVVLPLGAGSIEHGPHLTLGTDQKLAEYLTARVAGTTPIVVAPTLTYHYHPGFLEYPGSASLTVDAARDMTASAIRSLAAFGPRRFYVLNAGTTSLRALALAAEIVAADGILLRYTDYPARLDRAARGIREQSGGTHADEIETSMMLFVDSSSVDMNKAAKDYVPSTGTFTLTRSRDAAGIYSPTGTWGDPTLASRDKGRAVVDFLVSAIGDDIQALRTASLPTRTTTTAPTPPSPVPAARTAADNPATPGDRCAPLALRQIMAIGDAYAAAWANADSIRIGALWSESGNIIHTDGTIEHGTTMITQNRAAMFARPEYRGSRHPLVFTLIRCFSEDVAIADGRWNLRGMRDSRGQPVPDIQGQATMVVKRHGAVWKIEAYRYTVSPK